MMIEIYTDGASRGNPGKSASSFIVVNDKKIVYFASEMIGEATNNIAEYKAVINALEYAYSHGIKEVVVHSDSKVIISQINGNYKVKADHLKKLLEKVQLLKSKFKAVYFVHLNRENEFIQVADKLCNTMLDLEESKQYER
jgi:ribonuclease HI